MTRDPRFTLLEEALSAHEPASDAPTDNAEGSRQASVSLVLREAPSFEVLLIKRAEVAGDPWSGHMALPGGRRDAGDPTLLATAIRETAEETGVVLTESEHLLGSLDRASPWTSHVPRLSIHPFVFGVPSSTTAMAASREVQSVHWASLESLRDPASQGTFEYALPTGSRTFPCFLIDGQAVWGLTYRILTRFLELAPRGA
ncbi:MAG: CoA pyrophosphatase [Longimicrobiales bacterium]